MKTLLILLCLTVTMSIYLNAVSQITWSEYNQNPVLSPGSSGSWDDNSLDQHGILIDGDEYKLWYSAKGGEQFAIGYAHSADGLVWNKYGSAPVFAVGAPGSWDDEGVKAPKVLYVNGLYRMWYRGCSDSGWHTEVGYAESANGISWDRYGQPVLPLGASGSWDSNKIWDLSVIYDGGIYKMWYTAQDDYNVPRIGYATSTNCTTWTKYPNNPVFDVGNLSWWDEFGVGTSVVLHSGSQFEMWYYGGSLDTSGLGYATSNDGIEWVRFDTLAPIWPLHGEAGNWDDFARWSPVILFENSHYSMWYNGASQDSTGRIGYASAPASTGIRDDWPPSNQPVAFCLMQIHPNPFNASTVTSFELPVPSHVSLRVYDTAGKLVATLVNGWMPAGGHQATFHGSDLPSGIYLARFMAGDFQQTQKLVLLK